ncbi:MAG: RluA family pseudouridine synthase [Roseburia sp.]|nr:RluA family pseudouridine synthase [Anaeroplasma bactoclasticum]MCM1197110.1 RluA family pseudouridine synthase [Roseburia sp.]MCM1556499.1 RluA family pseudouridine synthase [Anaeroplasma bactoclasticum]
MINILYEDNHIIVAIKPKGVLSQADGSDKEDMLTLLKSYIKEKYQKPGNVYLGLVHRLDLFTSGVMVFARTSKAASRLTNQVQTHTFEKKYLAIVEGNLFGSDTLKSYLVKNEKEKKSYINSKGQEAILSYTAIDIKENRTLLDISLKTGRFHQIRCQLSSIGHPLYGDIKYGSTHKISFYDFPLEAYFLGFNHPVTNERLTFEHKTLHL